MINENQVIEDEMGKKKWDDYLPESYKLPNTIGHYMKFQQGENKFRAISPPVLGWLDWYNNKPVRIKFVEGEKPPKPNDPKRPIKHIWIQVVYNYNDKAIQILEIAQATIQKSIMELANDPEWGSPANYDIKVIRTGEGLDTKYTVQPSPHRTLSKEVIEAVKKTPVNLEALFTGDNPFEVKTASNKVGAVIN